jgi:hypothetical protein
MNRIFPNRFSFDTINESELSLDEYFKVRTFDIFSEPINCNFNLNEINNIMTIYLYIYIYIISK